MNNLKQHIIFKTITLLLSVSLLIPTAYKFAHIFENHHHDICKGESATHLHEINADCDFYKFKLNNTQFYEAPKSIEIPTIVTFVLLNHATYNFLYNHQSLSFSLRGPPALV